MGIIKIIFITFFISNISLHAVEEISPLKIYDNALAEASRKSYVGGYHSGNFYSETVKASYRSGYSLGRGLRKLFQK